MNQFPFWRYLIIIALVIFGVLYSLPVLYGEDPAIQITTKNAAALTPEITTKLADVLKQQNVKYLEIKSQNAANNILIRFPDIDSQLKAQDIIQATLGNEYTVALNLAPRMPQWLQALGAKPMRLGLDLRGGIHFLLQVDVDAMIKERMSADSHAFGTQLRQAEIRYTSIVTDPSQKVSLQFLNQDELGKGLQYLQKNFPDYVFQTSTTSGAHIEAQMRQEALNQLKLDAVQQNITTLRNRVNELGVAEPVIMQQGQDLISVDLPGVQDTARAKEMIGKVATVRFQLVDIDHNADQVAASGSVPFGSTLYQYEGRPLLVKNQVILHGSSILNANTISGEDGRPAVSIRTGGSEVGYFSRVTSENINKPLATIYVETQTNKQLINNKIVTSQKQIEKVISMANIQSTLGNQFQITGLDSMAYAQNLALLLRSGAYAAPVQFIQERLVGPSLGKENIRLGVISCEIAYLLVVIFMALYYRVFGLVADLALILNVLLVIAIMSILGATMTLPGMAALVLTVGMSVDGNVLINERIREELRNGMSPLASIRAGYDRAFSTIVDANVTTLIVAVVLFALGTGPVQGFAVTLTIGILASMVTSIYFTRTLVHLIYGRRNVKKLSIGINVPTAKGYRSKNAVS